MDLVTLFQLVPPLLVICVEHNDYRVRLGADKAYADLKVLRLVNKESSRVALAGLRLYTLTLTGARENGRQLRDTNVGGANLLQHARLGRLKVRLRLSGSYSPAEFLKDFIRGAEPSLSTVTRLELRYENTGGSSLTTAALDQAMALLAAACPYLKSISISENSPVAFLRSLGEACPLLTELTITAQNAGLDQEDLPNLQELISLQSTMLPNISSLSLPNLHGLIPDMSQNTGIVSLSISTQLTQENDWFCLPRSLKHLKVPAVIGGPQACKTITDALSHLLSIDVDCIDMSLHAVAQLVREGVIPHKILAHPQVWNKIHLTAQCVIDHYTAADLSCLDQQMQMDGMDRFNINCCFTLSSDHGCTRDFLSSLPCIRGIKCCTLQCQYGNLLPSIHVFPDLETITINDCDALTDLEMHVLTTCTKLSGVFLQRCKNITPMGVLAFCLHLPEDSFLSFGDCELLQNPHLQVCRQLLTKYESHYVELTDQDDEFK